MVGSSVCSDFKFICGEKQEILHAHKVILVSRSNYFKQVPKMFYIYFCFMYLLLIIFTLIATYKKTDLTDKNGEKDILW